MCGSLRKGIKGTQWLWDLVGWKKWLGVCGWIHTAYYYSHAIFTYYIVCISCHIWFPFNS